MKKCPHCSQSIQDEAIRCKYCKGDIGKRAKKLGKLGIVLIVAVGIILSALFRLFLVAYEDMKSVPLKIDSAESEFEREEIEKGENLISFQDEKQMFGYKNKLTGEIEIKPQFEFAGQFSEGRALIGIGRVVDGPGGYHKYGFINPEGKIVIKPKFCHASSFSRGLADVYFCEIGKAGYINKNGDLAIDTIFDNAFSFSEGLAAVELRDLGWGFIGHEGTFVIEPYFGSASSFSEGLACVSVGGKFGYINLFGDFVINPQFEYVGDTSSPDFKDGTAKVKREGEFFYINKKGEVVDAPPSKN